MSKKVRKKKKSKPRRLSQERFNRYYIALESGEDSSVGNYIYWDLAGGERAHLVKADFEFVARKSKIEVIVTIERGERSLRLTFPPSKPAKVTVRRGEKELISHELCTDSATS